MRVPPKDNLTVARTGQVATGKTTKATSTGFSDVLADVSARKAPAGKRGSTLPSSLASSTAALTPKKVHTGAKPVSTDDDDDSQEGVAIQKADTAIAQGALAPPATLDDAGDEDGDVAEALSGPGLQSDGS
jgi:hypothetical protein